MTKKKSMKQVKSGIKGFVKLPNNEVKNKRVVFYLNKAQMLSLKDYCTKNNLLPSELIRERLKDIIKD